MSSPKFFKLVLNQIFKDIRGQRWLIFGWLAFLGIHLLEQWHGGLPEAWATMDSAFETGAHLLAFLIAWFIVAEIYFEDPPMSLAPFWRSRPLGAGGVLLGKLCFVVLVILIPLGINQFVALQCAETSLGATLLHCLRVMTVVGLWSVLVATLASIAGDWARFLIWSVFLVGSIICLDMSKWHHPVVFLALTAVVVTSIVILPLAWWLRNRLRMVIGWFGGTACYMLVSSYTSHTYPAAPPKLQPYSAACGYTDFLIHPRVEPNDKPLFEYRCRPTWLAEGEERMAILGNPPVVNGTIFSPFSVGTTLLDRPLETIGYSHDKAISGNLENLLPRLSLPASKELTAELQRGYQFSTTYDDSTKGLGRLSPGDVYHTTLTIQRQRSQLLISVPLDRPGIYRRRGFTIRVLTNEKELPTVRVSQPDLLSKETSLRYSYLARPLYFKTKDGQSIPIGYEDEYPSYRLIQFMVLGKIGRQTPQTAAVEPRPPLPAGELQLYTTIHLPVEYYELHVPVGDPAPSGR